jgi:hypothetical protein
MEGNNSEFILKQLAELLGTNPNVTLETQQDFDKVIAQLQEELKYANNYRIKQSIIDIKIKLGLLTPNE